ncbi:MAG: type IX secretion system membrane protein PorP/SprF [Bacteroidaceae bacterium]|nr:type IX secretion system membrane protein PorP/SprF [Bacteroidaceae bacterium]
MMRQRITAILVLFFIVAITMRAQWDVQFSDYTALKSYYNPASSGADGMLNVQAAYSMQMVGYKNAPQTMYVSADMPVYFLSPRHGGGISFFNDNAGIFSTTKISLQYAYNIKVGEKGRLAAGFQGAVLTEKIDPAKATLEESNDPAFPSSAVDGNRVDLGAGFYYHHPSYWAGISSLHLLAPTVVVGERYEISIDRMFYLMGGCNIKLKNSLLSVHPSFMVQSNLTSWREDLQCKVMYEYDGRVFYGGLGYSPDISTTVFIGGVFHGVCIGYNYQMYTQGIGMLNGSHELVFGYKTDLDLFKKGRNKHKSVRWL